ncbi:MAG: GGDEF domain-containing protein [Lachnospiraceae bacterium]|nr:GGDEF domain-containing protein [Lachnospiraceae bacterium]
MTDSVHLFIPKIITFFVIVLVATFFISIDPVQAPDDSYVIDGPYDVTINGKSYEAVDLETFSFPPVVRGDHMTVSFELPNVKIPNAMLTFYQDHSAVQVFYDGKFIMNKGTPGSLMVGYGHYNVQLPDNYSGMHVEIVYDIIENEGVKTIEKPVINNSATYIRRFIAEKSLFLVIDIAIIILCIAIMLISCMFSRITESFERLVYLGAAFFMMAVWELCNYDMIKIFSENLMLKGYLEYISLYVGPFFLSLYFYIEFFSTGSEKVRKTYKVIMIIQGMFPLIGMGLHFADIIHLPALLQEFHIILIVNIAFMSAVLFKRFRKSVHTHQPMIIGLIVIVAMFAFDMIRFILYKTFFPRMLENFISFLLIGFFVFFMAILMDFFLSQKNSMYMVARAEAMDRLAHVDIMTGLANRTRCEEIFVDLTFKKDIFSIISIDINYLKLTNDMYGHQEGDRLLTDIAKLMKDACGDEDVIPGRMGGDEFIIIIPGITGDTDRKIVTKMDADCAELNKNRKPVPLSFSYGICRSDEVTASNASGLVEEAYRLADERMYEMKTKMKARREDVL